MDLYGALIDISAYRRCCLKLYQRKGAGGMDQKSTGELIRKLKTDMGLTQKQLAEQLHVSDKAVSKWECGNGSPDLSLFTALSEVFGMDIQVLLDGRIDKNEMENGNMKKLKLYVCKHCGNIITSTSDASVTCCGNRLSPLEPRAAEGSEKLKLEDIGGEWYVTSDHEMSKDNYVSFAAFVNDSTAMIFKQYPEWTMKLRMPLYRSGRLVWYSAKEGLMYMDIRA